MDFREYVSREGRGVLKRIERESGCGYSTLLRLSQGRHLDSASLAKRISDATGGEVTEIELLGLQQAWDAT